MTLDEVVAYGVIALFFGLILLCAWAADQPDDWMPMSYEEEKRWLMEDCGLDEEEAEDIANIPWRR